MKNRGAKLSVLGIVIVVIGILAVSHSAMYFHNYRTSQITGLALADANNIEQENPKSQSISLIFIIGEWTILITTFIAGRAIRKRNSRREIKKIIGDKKNVSASAKTDIDVLYEILKHQKKLGISDIAAAFTVSKDVAMDWCKILEDNNMADIEYASLGEPSIKMK